MKSQSQRNTISRNLQYKDVYGKLMNKQHHACILEANYYRPQRSWGKVIFSCIRQEFCSQEGSPGPHPGWRLRGLAGGVVSRPTPMGEVEGSGWGGLQAHTWGGLQAHPLGGRGGCIPACNEADTPQQTVSAAGDVHPTGMHACKLSVCDVQLNLTLSTE